LEEKRMPKNIFTRELEGPTRKEKPRKGWKGRKGSSCARSEEMERVGDR
jgi:hypothetical protein